MQLWTGFVAFRLRFVGILARGGLLSGVSASVVQKLEDVDLPGDCFEVFVDPLQWRGACRMLVVAY